MYNTQLQYFFFVIFTCFVTGIPSSQRTVAFEKACILFNLAGVYTQIATKQDRSTEKGLDIAVDNFLRAAGIFKHIYETFTNAPSIDLKPQFLEILVALMLAQARECLYEKLLLQIESFSISNKNHVSESIVYLQYTNKSRNLRTAKKKKRKIK